MSENTVATNVVETMPLGELDFIGGNHPVVERRIYVRFEVPGQRPDAVTGEPVSVLVPAPGVPTYMPVGTTITVAMRWVDNTRLDYTGEITGPPLVVCDPSFGAGSVGGDDREVGRVRVSVTHPAVLRRRSSPGGETTIFDSYGAVSSP